MPYTPPSGDDLIFDWQGQSGYTPPAGDSLVFSWAPDDPFGDVVQPIDISIMQFGDVDQPINISFGPPYGDVDQSIDISLLPVWEFWGDRVIQIIDISFTSFGDVVQPIDVHIASPHGDVVQPIDVHIIGEGDVVQPINISMRDPFARTTIWKVRAIVGGVDITARTTGQGSVRAEEGGARIASFTLVPEIGPIDAEAMSGMPVILDILLRNGAYSATRRLFTGKVDKPVFNVSRGAMDLSCTDDLQNRVAALTREQIDHITGGRFHLAVQQEQTNNWEYAQAVMKTVPGALDADAYGALRTTLWHTAEVWQTYSPANTEQGSIEFTPASNTGIVNQIVGTFEYRFTRLHRRTASMNYMGDMEKTIHYGLPLLARSTFEAALEGTGWNFYYGGSAIGAPGSGSSDTRFKVTDGQPLTRNINYIPYPEQVDIPGGGIWYQKETDTTFLSASCSMWKRWAQTVTMKYTLTVKAPESIAANGLRQREDRASMASEWDASSWESDPSVEPSLPITGFSATLDYAPDATPEDRDLAISIFLDTLDVEIDGSHRSARASARTWLTPELDLDKRVRIEKGDNAGEGKVVSVEHNWDMTNGRATTDFEIAITRHGGVGILPPDDTPTDAPEAPAAPVPGTPIRDALYTAPSLHIGALADSPDEDENWTGWIVNVPPSFNIDDPGSDTPKINPETQKTEREKYNSEYKGGTKNPLYRADKAYSQTGFRVKFPAVEDESRDEATPAIAAEYLVPIPQDEFTLTA